MLNEVCAPLSICYKRRNSNNSSEVSMTMTKNAVKLLLKRVSGILWDVYVLAPVIAVMLLIVGLIVYFVWMGAVASIASKTATWIDNMHPPSQGELYGLNWSVVDVRDSLTCNAYRYHIRVYNNDGVLLLDRRCILWRRTPARYADFIKRSVSDAARIQREVSAVKEAVNTSLAEQEQQ